MAERVFFESFSPVSFQAAEREGQLEPIRARGELYLPRRVGERRVPGVVVIEGLGGLKDERERAYGALFARRGYAALVVDSFGSRDASDLADEMRALLVTEAMMCADAFGALRFLRKHPNVDPDRICIIGFSYGGMISVLTAYAQVHDLFASHDEVFAAHVAFYGCSVIRLERTRTTGKKMPLSIPLMAIFFNGLNGFFIGYYLGNFADGIGLFLIVYRQWKERLSLHSFFSRNHRT